MLSWIKFQLKAVPVAVRLGHGGQGRVSFGPDAHIPVGLAIHDNRAGNVLFRQGVVQHGLPILGVRQQIHLVDLLRGKKPGGIGRVCVGLLKPLAENHQRTGQQDHQRGG